MRRKIQTKKKDYLHLKDYKINLDPGRSFVISLWYVFAFNFFIMILSMGIQCDFIHLHVIISLYMDIKYVIKIDDFLLKSN